MKKMKKWSAVLGLVLVALVFLSLAFSQTATAPAHAEQPDSTATGIQSPEPGIPPFDPFVVFIKAMGLLLLLGVLLYGVLKMYKNQTSFRSGLKGSNVIELLHTSYIGPKKSLCLVEVLDRILLLGVTENQINVLMQLTAEDVDENAKNALLVKKEGSNRQFKEILKQVLGK